MLVLSRKRGEAVRIGQEVEVTVLEVHGNRVKLGVVGPRHIPVQRDELRQAGGQAAPTRRAR